MKFFFLNIGCQKTGDEVQNIYTIAHAINQSPENTLEWQELDIQLQHPRTDSGYFQLGKYSKKKLICREKSKNFSIE
jgi:hypothetical protein